MTPQAPTQQPHRAPSGPPQYSKARIAAVWAAAAVPMGVGAWLVAPALAGSRSGDRFAETLLAVLTAGLVWQSVIVAASVARERGSLSWTTLRDALWLGPPTDAAGRRSGRRWLWLLVPIIGFAVVELAPVGVPAPSNRDFGAFLGSTEGQDLLHGNWGLFALIVVMAVFNTVLGEELLFRGLLLPRMRQAFGRADWLANGVLFGLYHLSQPWSIPDAVLTGWVAAYATRRTRCAWMGIVAHSMQSLLFVSVALVVVLS